VAQHRQVKVLVNKLKTMKNLNIRIWFATLALLGLITGISINGVWSFSYQFTFISGPEMFYWDWVNHRASLRSATVLLLVFISQIAILVLPFISYRNINIRKWAVYIPLVYIIAQILVWSFLSFVLIPFIVVWIGLLLYLKKHKNQLKSEVL